MPFDLNRTDLIAQVEALLNLGSPESTVIPSVAAATPYEIGVYKAPSGGSGTTVNRMSIFADVAIAAVATNFQTLQFRQFRAGALVGLFAGATTYATTAALAVLTEKVLFTGSVTLQPGDVITLQNVTTGTGAALPVLSVTIEASPTA